ncbi:DUF3243 family protein [Sporosarcina globispora]|uniref:DUF3243 family protein n=1 Tax=Sporosarcina globispora TaxID=1459 RepID=UPI003BF54511
MNTAQRVGDYLASREEPRNREGKLLQELWKVGTEQEKQIISYASKACWLKNIYIKDEGADLRLLLCL